MKYCKNCGSQLYDEATVCPNCGTPQGGNDSGSFGWAILGCCIPLAGLILFLVWHDQKPKTAEMAGIGALVGVVIGLIGTLLSAGSGFALGILGL